MNHYDKEITELLAHFPPFKNTLPLAVGILKQIFDDPTFQGIPRVHIRKAVYRWCHSEEYVKTLTTSKATRYSLYGSPVDLVTKADYLQADKKLKSMQKPGSSKGKGRGGSRRMNNNSDSLRAASHAQGGGRKPSVAYKKRKKLVLPSMEVDGGVS